MRVPQHRQIDLEGRLTEEDIATQIRDEREASRPVLLAVERNVTGDVIGYCGLVFNGNGSNDEPELAFKLLRAVHNQGYATEAAWAVIGPVRADRSGRYSAARESPAFRAT